MLMKKMIIELSVIIVLIAVSIVLLRFLKIRNTKNYFQERLDDVKNNILDINEAEYSKEINRELRAIGNKFFYSELVIVLLLILILAYRLYIYIK